MIKKPLARAILALVLVLSTLSVAAADAQKNFEKAKEAYLKKDYRGAEKQLRALTKADPDFDFGHLYLGHSLFYQGKFDEAIPEYEKAMELGMKAGDMKQEDVRLLTDQLGMSYGISGHLDKAKALFEQGIQKDAEYAMYYYNLACTNAELGNLDDAVVNLKKGFERKQNMLPSETYPSPRTDDSFKRYLGNPKFEAALKEMGF